MSETFSSVLVEKVGKMLRVPAKLDYTLRALIDLELHGPAPITGDAIARRQGVPFRFLEVSLAELRVAGVVDSRRGVDGGYWLTRPGAEITVADITLAVEGDIIGPRTVRGADSDAAMVVSALWDRLGNEVERLLAGITIADLATGDMTLPAIR